MSKFQMGKIKDERKFLRDLVYEKLQQSLLEEKFNPGDKITEKEIAEELGVSRTPVREALYRLAATGLIKVIPHRGFIVSKWTVKELKDVMAVRMVLEKLAIKLAIENILPEEVEELKILVIEIEKAVKDKNIPKASDLNTLFHDKIILASRNKELFEIMKFLKNKICGFRIIALSSPKRLDDSLKEHRRILDVIINKDVDSAQTLIHEHIQRIGSIIEEKLRMQKQKDTFELYSNSN